LRVKFHYFLSLFLLLGLTGCAGNRRAESRWTGVLGPELYAMGYRNWVVVGDAAFPAHSRRGVRTLLVDGEIPEVLDGVLDSLESTQNVSPRIYLARELRYVTNDRAPGIDEHRRLLKKAMHGHPSREMDYRSLSLLLEDSANTFSVLVLKTKTALPYSSVFIEMDSAYWDVESEREMRERIRKADEKKQS
jgi:L-fucose mutarotase/ribose pyranase (RbsD/FucU family)